MIAEPAAWEYHRIDELCTVTRGASPRPIQEWMAPVGTPWIKIADATGDPSRQITKTKEYIRDEGRAKSVVVHPGDFILSNSATPGIPKFVGIEACIHDGWLLLRDFHKVDPNFLYYLFLNDRKDLVGQGNGSIFTNLKTDIVKRHRILLPPMSEQRAIADVLGALDDKITANTKLAGTANDLASNLFLEAVRGTSPSDQSFADLATVSGGGTPSTKHPDYWDGNVNWATPTDVTGLAGPYLEATIRTISEGGLQACSSSLYPAGSILMTSRATIGAFAFAEKPMAVNQGFIVVEPKNPAHKFWLFHEMRSRTDEFTAMANGATFLELSRGNFKKFRVRLADPERMREFEAKAEALHTTARSAFRENQTLSAARAALLPQLVAGKIRVSDVKSLISASEYELLV